MKFIENSVEEMSPINFEIGELYIFGSGEWESFYKVIWMKEDIVLKTS